MSEWLRAKVYSNVRRITLLSVVVLFGRVMIDRVGNGAAICIRGRAM